MDLKRSKASAKINAPSTLPSTWVTLDSKSDSKDDEARKTMLKNYYPENTSHLIMEFSEKASKQLIKSIRSKLENEKFKIIKYGPRMYLTGDELSLLFEAELIGLIKYNAREGCFKRFKIEDYFDMDNINYETQSHLPKILTRSEKIRICQHIIEENIQVSKRVYIEGIGHLYPAQSFILVCARLQLIDYFPLHDDELRPLTSALSLYMILMGLINMPVNWIREYFDETIGIYFNFLDKLIKFQSVPMLSYLFILVICDLDRNHPIIPIGTTLVVYFSFLVFLKIWRFSSFELHCMWRLDEDIIAKKLKGPILDYECTNGLYHPSLEIRQLIPKPDESSKQHRAQRITWLIIFFTFIFLVYMQIRFFLIFLYQNEQPEDGLFFPLLIHFIVLKSFRRIFIRFLIYRTNREEYFTLQDYQINLFSRVFLVDMYIFHSLPLMSLIFSKKSHTLRRVLASQIMIKLTVDLVLLLIYPIIRRFYKNLSRVFRENKYMESQFVLSESSKEKLDTLLLEWTYLIVEMSYNLMYSSIYPRIIVISYLNIMIRSYTNFIKICVLCKRPLFIGDYYSRIMDKMLDSLFMMASLINFLHLENHLSSLNIKLGLPSYQLNMLVVLCIFLTTSCTYLLPSQSAKAKSIRQMQQLEKFAIYRLLDESNINETVTAVSMLLQEIQKSKVSSIST